VLSTLFLTGRNRLFIPKEAFITQVLRPGQNQLCAWDSFEQTWEVTSDNLNETNERFLKKSSEFTYRTYYKKN